MKIILISTLTRLRLPGRNADGSLINPDLKDQVKLCYEICDENREWITTRVGHTDRQGNYIEHTDEREMRFKLQTALGSKKFGVHAFPMPDGAHTRFEAIRVFPCEVVIEIKDAPATEPKGE